MLMVKDVLLSHFQKFPLLSDKQKDFELFSKVCDLVTQKEHLSSNGLKKIVDLAFQMNPSGKRKYTKEIITNSLVNL